jgi:hypothetical protein
MLYAILICSDPDCAEEFTAFGAAAELDELACECGCTLQAIAFGEAEPAEIGAAVKQLRPRQPELRRVA